MPKFVKKRTKKRSMKRKRMFTLRRRIGQRYDQGVLVKCQARKFWAKANWTGGDTDFQNRFTVHWASGGNQGSHEIGLTDSPEFVTYTSSYMQYSVRGVKMEFLPDRVLGASSGEQYGTIHSGSAMIPGDALITQMTPERLMRTKDYRKQSGYHRLKRYVNVGKYARNSGFVQRQSTADNQVLAKTDFLLDIFGQQVGVRCGCFVVTYYVKFNSIKQN